MQRAQPNADRDTDTRTHTHTEKTHTNTHRHNAHTDKTTPDKTSAARQDKNKYQTRGQKRRHDWTTQSTTIERTRHDTKQDKT